MLIDCHALVGGENLISRQKVHLHNDDNNPKSSETRYVGSGDLNEIISTITDNR